MRAEEKLLLSVCQCYLNGSSLNITDEISWKDFYRLSKNHNMLGICQCVFSSSPNADIPDNVRQLYTDKFFDQIYIFEKQTAEFNDIRQYLTEAGIAFVAFKGVVLRNIYPVPESRSMGDIDILISEKDAERAKGELKRRGFVLEASNGTVNEYMHNGVILEIHTNMLDKFGENAFADAFDNSDFNGFEGQLDDSYHFAYLIAHTAKHLKYTGAGIRFVLDLAIMLRESDIDLDRVFEMLEKMGLTTFGKVIVSVCSEWFGYGKRFAESTDTVQRYLINDGVFGSLKDSNSATVSRLIQCDAFDSDNGKNADKSSLLLKLKLAFPPYATLRKAEYINFIDGRPWLLPVAWVYRFCYNLKNNRKHMIQTVKNVSDEKTALLAKEELEFFEEIGIL